MALALFCNGLDSEDYSNCTNLTISTGFSISLTISLMTYFDMIIGISMYLIDSVGISFMTKTYLMTYLITYLGTYTMTSFIISIYFGTSLMTSTSLTISLMT